MDSFQEEENDLHLGTGPIALNLEVRQSLLSGQAILAANINGAKRVRIAAVPPSEKARDQTDLEVVPRTSARLDVILRIRLPGVANLQE